MLFSCIASSTAQDRKATASLENKLLTAVSDYVAGDVSKAETVLEQITSKDPSMDAAWYYLGMCQMSSRKTSKALASIRKAVELSPDNFWYRDRLALMEFYFGSRDEGIAIYEQMRKDFPKDSQIPYNLANIYMQSGRLEDAVGVMDDIERESGRSETVTRIRYNLLMQLDRQEDALASLLAYNEEYSSPEILSLAGDHYAMVGEYSPAVESYKEALELQSDYIPALGGLAEAYRSFGHDDEFFAVAGGMVTDPSIPVPARKAFLDELTETRQYYVSRNIPRVDSLMVKAVEAAPADSSMTRTAAYYFARSGRIDKSTELFGQLAKDYPADSSAVATYIEVLLYQEKWREASDAAKEAAGQMGVRPFLMDMKNYADYKLKDYDALIGNAAEMLKSPDKSVRVSAYSSIGDIYHEKGDEKKAFAAYEKALKLDPDYAPVLNNYAYYLSLKGKKLKKAYSMSKKTVEADPDNATYLDTFAWILHLMGRDLEAKPQLKHAMLYGGKDSAVILDHYAEVLYALKEYEMARIYWKQAVAKNDGNIPGLEEKIAAKLAAVGL